MAQYTLVRMCNGSITEFHHCTDKISAVLFLIRTGSPTACKNLLLQEKTTPHTNKTTYLEEKTTRKHKECSCPEMDDGWFALIDDTVLSYSTPTVNLRIDRLEAIITQLEKLIEQGDNHGHQPLNHGTDGGKQRHRYPGTTTPGSNKPSRRGDEGANL